MKKFSTLKLSAAVAFTALLCAPTSGSAASILETAGNFSLLANTAVSLGGGSGTVTGGNIGAGAAISGFKDSVPTGAGPAILADPYRILAAGAIPVPLALTDLIRAHTGLSNMVPDTDLTNVEMAGLTLKSGVYGFNAAATFTGGGTLTLDADHQTSAYWVFQVSTTMNAGASCQVVVINDEHVGANIGIFFVSKTADLVFNDTNTLRGNYLAYTKVQFDAAGPEILNGRAMGRTAAVTFAGIAAVNALGGPGGIDYTGVLTYAGDHATVVVPQAITFNALPAKTAGNPAFIISATNDRGKVVNFVSGNLGIATVGASTLLGNVSTATVNIVGPGTAIITASSGAVSYIQAATSVPQPLLVAAAGSPPFITNTPLTVPATVGTPFSFTITASGGPTSYVAAGLPPSLTFNAQTGTISGTPTATGTIFVTLTAANSFGSSNATLTIKVAAAGIAPIITNNPLTAAGTLGTPFAFTITATGTPTSYAATALPPGLSMVGATGAITGTPFAAGSYVVPLSATNATGTGTATLTITVAPAAVAPIITSPTTAPGTFGTPFVTYLITATGLPTSYAAAGLPLGLTLNTLTGAINGTPLAVGISVATLSATNSTGTGTATLTITVAPAGVAPIITSPATAPAIAGTPFVTYLIAATGLPTSYTATGLPPGLTLDPLTGAINGTPTTAGIYAVTITATNTSGTSTATLTITVAAVASSRIVNFSARALSGPGDQTLIMGFVVAGDNKHLLVRGIGPSLASFGIVNFLADPLLTLYGTNSAVAMNDDWQFDSSGLAQGSLIQAAAAQVGAFTLPNGSKDSALLFTVNNGAHTTGLLRPNSTTGVALTEIYDMDTVLGSRLINVSARMNVTAGEGTLIAGLVIKGNTPKTVLIRGVGPTLSVFGVGGVLADPQISVVSGSTQIASNDNWETGTSTAAQISAASAQVGAFALPSGSKDAALLITLQPGSYTVVVTGVGSTTGVALVEVYDVL